jgi:hypothetical protein
LNPFPKIKYLNPIPKTPTLSPIQPTGLRSPAGHRTRLGRVAAQHRVAADPVPA